MFLIFIMHTWHSTIFPYTTLFRSYVEEAIYKEHDLTLLKTVQKKSPLGIDFIPVQEFPVNELLSESLGQSEISALRDRKSTRLNSSHVAISYAVFCLKKKKSYIV